MDRLERKRFPWSFLSAFSFRLDEALGLVAFVPGTLVVGTRGIGFKVGWKKLEMGGDLRADPAGMVPALLEHIGTEPVDV